MKKFLALLFVVCMVLCAGCGKEEILSAAQAQEIAYEALEITAEQVSSVHPHVTEYEGQTCYSFHITVGDYTHEVVVDGYTGQVLHIGEGGH